MAAVRWAGWRLGPEICPVLPHPPPPVITASQKVTLAENGCGDVIENLDS